MGIINTKVLKGHKKPKGPKGRRPPSNKPRSKEETKDSIVGLAPMSLKRTWMSPLQGPSRRRTMMSPKVGLLVLRTGDLQLELGQSLPILRQHLTKVARNQQHQLRHQDLVWRHIKNPVTMRIMKTAQWTELFLFITRSVS